MCSLGIFRHPDMKIIMRSIKMNANRRPLRCEAFNFLNNSSIHLLRWKGALLLFFLQTTPRVFCRLGLLVTSAAMVVLVLVFSIRSYVMQRATGRTHDPPSDDDITTTNIIG